MTSRNKICNYIFSRKCVLITLTFIELGFLLCLCMWMCRPSSPLVTQTYRYSPNLLVNLTFGEVNLLKFHDGSNKSMSRLGSTGSIYLLRLVNYRLDADRQYIAFPLGLTAEEREVTLALLQTFAQVCAVFKIPFFLYGGSLVGSLRHHDIIPWDDDIDVMLNSEDRDVLRHAMRYSPENVQLHSPEHERWKLYWTNGRPIRNKEYRWPYIDIFFFAENQSHIYDEQDVYRKEFNFPKAHVFPLCLRPFAGRMLPVPYNSLAVAGRNYNLSMCHSLEISHKLEVTLFQRYIVPCSQLRNLYPFVHRSFWNGYLHEKLVYRGRIVHTVVIPENCSRSQ